MAGISSVPVQGGVLRMSPGYSHDRKPQIGREKNCLSWLGYLSFEGGTIYLCVLPHPVRVAVASNLSDSAL